MTTPTICEHAAMTFRVENGKVMLGVFENKEDGLNVELPLDPDVAKFVAVALVSMAEKIK